MKPYLAKLKTYFKKKHVIDLVRDPIHDWSVLLACFMLLVAIVLMGEGLMFYKISKGEWFTTDNSESTSDVKVQSATLKKVVDAYTLKQQKTRELILNSASSTNIVDPSQ